MRARILIVALVALAWLPAAFAQVQTAPAAAAIQNTVIGLEAGTGRVVQVPAGIGDVFVADPKVAEVRPASPTSLFVFGTGPGHTTVAVVNGEGHTTANFDISVQPSSFNATSAAAAIARSLPQAHIRVEAEPKGLMLTGTVPNPAAAETAQGIAGAYLADGQVVDNRLNVAALQQVGLRVRVAEMSRSLTRALGINWQALGNVGIAASTANVVNKGVLPPPASLIFTYASNVNGLIDALATDNLVRVLAEPTLTAISGEAASFLVGGEFPIPVGQQGNTVTIDFKQYGVALTFLPTVMSDDLIRLHVRPEVSQLTQAGAVQITAGNSSVSVPALTVRRADTTVELGSGQSFAIAGLLQYDSSVSANYLPFLGDIPILGELFRSESFQRNETELVIIVTPYIVRPLNDASALQVPGPPLHQLSDLDRIAAIQYRKDPVSPVLPHILGQAGFIVP
nr:type II and III secretion system protein family protein [uncultured Rhodopila sp.]